MFALYSVKKKGKKSYLFSFFPFSPLKRIINVSLSLSIHFSFTYLEMAYFGYVTGKRTSVVHLSLLGLLFLAQFGTCLTSKVKMNYNALFGKLSFWVFVGYLLLLLLFLFFVFSGLCGLHGKQNWARRPR